MPESAILPWGRFNGGVGCSSEHSFGAQKCVRHGGCPGTAAGSRAQSGHASKGKHDPEAGCNATKIPSWDSIMLRAQIAGINSTQ